MSQPTTITLQDLPIRSANVVGKVVEGEKSARLEAILVLPEKGQVKVLNELGARIWELIDGKNLVRDLVERITAEYAVSAEQAGQDIIAFLGELREKGIITLCTPGATG